MTDIFVLSRSASPKGLVGVKAPQTHRIVELEGHKHTFLPNFSTVRLLILRMGTHLCDKMELMEEDLGVGGKPLGNKATECEYVGEKQAV